MDTNPSSGEQSDGPNLFRPDDVIRPGQVMAPPQPTADKDAVYAQPPDESSAMQAAAAVSEPVSAMPQERESGATADDGSDYSINWTASEFVAHTKSAGWYGLLALGAVSLSAIAWLITRDTFATGTVLIGALLLGIYAARKPREETYRLDPYGLMIGQRQYSYSEFRSFAIVPEGAFLSIELTPLKRFAMYTTIYFDPADADRIVDLLSSFLPMEEPGSNVVDGLMRRIHF